jgi:hypothetical protein
MTYEEALEIMKRGGSVQRGGKTYTISRGIQDVTDPENPERVYLTDADRAATDWETSSA